MTSILDTCAMLAYLQDEPGGMVVESILQENVGSCDAHSVNLCEVFIKFFDVLT